jgi:hypothetical protein
MKLLIIPAVAFCVVLGARFLEPQPPTELTTPFCNPVCDSCHVCFQLYAPPGQLRPPPMCVPKSPKPAGCP